MVPYLRSFVRPHPCPPTPIVRSRDPTLSLKRHLERLTRALKRRAVLCTNIDSPAVLCEAVGMSMRKTIEVIARLAEQGIIARYAIAGAVAALNYIEPTLTEDPDVLIAIGAFEKRESGLILLKPIEKALAAMGYSQRSDAGIVVEGWPVQFLPVASALDEEALDKAIEIEFRPTGEASIKARCIRAEHIVAIAVKLGRPKDWARVAEFLEQRAVNLASLQRVLQRHGLVEDWKTFCRRAGIENPLPIS